MTTPIRWQWAVVVLWLAVAGCGGGGANGAFTPGALPRGGEWTGIYFSDWGRMELQRNGDTVVGTFTSDIKRGRLSGSVNGNILRFTWVQQDDRIIGRPQRLNGSGVFQYYVDENDEHHLRGTWGYESSVDDGGTWNAARSRARLRPRSAPPVETGGSQGEGTEESAPEPTAPPIRGAGEGDSDAPPAGDPLDNL